MATWQVQTSQYYRRAIEKIADRDWAAIARLTPIPLRWLIAAPGAGLARARVIAQLYTTKLDEITRIQERLAHTAHARPPPISYIEKYKTKQNKTKTKHKKHKKKKTQHV